MSHAEFFGNPYVAHTSSEPSILSPDPLKALKSVLECFKTFNLASLGLIEPSTVGAPSAAAADCLNYRVKVGWKETD